jgi:hypothetical protein
LDKESKFKDKIEELGEILKRKRKKKCEMRLRPNRDMDHIQDPIRKVTCIKYKPTSFSQWKTQ